MSNLFKVKIKDTRMFEKVYVGLNGLDIFKNQN